MEKPEAINADGISEPFAAGTVPAEIFTRGSRFGPAGDIFRTLPAAPMSAWFWKNWTRARKTNPSHYHMLEEEHAYILQGSLTLRLGDKNYVMNAGDYVCFPAGQKVGHSLYNHTNAICRYLLVGERNPHDVIVYPESGRVGVRLTGEGYRKSSTMDYWEDIEGA